MEKELTIKKGALELVFDMESGAYVPASFVQFKRDLPAIAQELPEVVQDAEFTESTPDWLIQEIKAKRAVKIERMKSQLVSFVQILGLASVTIAFSAVLWAAWTFGVPALISAMEFAGKFVGYGIAGFVALWLIGMLLSGLFSGSSESYSQHPMEDGSPKFKKENNQNAVVNIFQSQDGASFGDILNSPAYRATQNRH